jgi:glycosyltransferase involved in cell wall biosynthesis
LDVFASSFAAVAEASGIELPHAGAKDAELSEASAAAFLLTLLRNDNRLRRRFPRALSGGEHGGFFKWLLASGRTELGVSDDAIRKIRGALRRPPGERIYRVYLNDPDLQQTYRVGLLPVGQRYFLDWLATHGRADQNLTREQIVWFLYATVEDQARGVALTYLLRADWQEMFPAALTRTGWKPFRQWLALTYGDSLAVALPRQLPRELIANAKAGAVSTIIGPSKHLSGVNILSHFTNPSGIQQAALWTKAALERSGLRTSCRDVPVPRHEYPIDRANWLGVEQFPVTILTHAAGPFFIRAYERSGLFRRDEVYRIAYWAWELEALPDEWIESAALVDEIWSPTEFVAKAMRTRISLPVHKMLPGVEVGPVAPVSRASLGIPEEHLVFLFMFDLHSQLHRKNPQGVIEAFRRAVRPGESATLVIKTSGGDAHPKDLARVEAMCRAENVLLIHKTMPRAEAYGLVAMSDCFISLHRSEGFGLGLAEAMLLGKPVIATGYSGNLDFMNRENSMLVDYQMVEITEDRPLYTRGNRWAEPSIAHAASYIRQVLEQPEEASERAAKVRPAIAQLLSVEAAGQRMRARLEQIAAELPPRGR